MGMAPLEQLGLRAGAAYSWHELDTRRSVAIPGLSDNPRAGYRAGTFQIFGELGYGFDPGSGMRLAPFANLAHVRLHTDGYKESGGAAALSGRSFCAAGALYGDARAPAGRPGLLHRLRPEALVGFRHDDEAALFRVRLTAVP